MNVSRKIYIRLDITYICLKTRCSIGLEQLTSQDSLFNIVTVGCRSCLRICTPLIRIVQEKMRNQWASCDASSSNEDRCIYIMLFQDIYDLSCSNLPYLHLHGAGGVNFCLAFYTIYCVAPHAFSYTNMILFLRNTRVKIPRSHAFTHIQHVNQTGHAYIGDERALHP